MTSDAEIEAELLKRAAFINPLDGSYSERCWKTEILLSHGERRKLLNIAYDTVKKANFPLNVIHYPDQMEKLFSMIKEELLKRSGNDKSSRQPS